MISMIMSDLPLGLDGAKIALHLLNFAILMAGLTFLLYKPVLKFIKKRQDTIKSQLEQSELAKKEAEQKMGEYKTKIDLVQTEIDRKIVEADKAMAVQKENIITQANKKAEEIFKKAEADSENERTEAINNLQNEVAEVAVNIATSILEREVSKEENAKIIDACIKEWSEND